MIIFADKNLTLPVVAGLVIGIGFVVLFAILESNGIMVRNTAINRTGNESSSALTIHPGGYPVHTCAFTHPVSISIINSTGFTLYNVSRGFSDYVIKPGLEGSLTYSIAGNAISQQGSGAIRVLKMPTTETYRNTPMFIHYRNVTLQQNVTALGPVTLQNGTVMQSYSACHRVPEDVNSTICSYGSRKEPPKDTITLAQMLLDHPGISESMRPANETLAFNESQMVTLTFSVASDAPRGTYWLQFSPGIYYGSLLVLFTVGNVPYSQIDNEPPFEAHLNP